MRVSRSILTALAWVAALASWGGGSAICSGQEWPEMSWAPPVVVRGQTPAAQGPIVYFDQDPTRAQIGPTPAAVQPPGAAYGMTGQNIVPIGMNNRYAGIFGEFLYLHPRGADVSFAVPQDGLGVGAVPVGPVAVADIGYHPGFRAGGFFTLDEYSLVEVTYSWFESDSTTNVSTAAPNVINPLTLFPGTFNAGFAAEQATADYGIDFQFIDADYMAMGICCPDYWAGYILGARYAQLDQNFTAVYPFAPPDGTTTLDSSVDFNGAGVRFGLIGERTLFMNTGFRIYGSGILNVLVGQFDARYVQTNQFNGVEASTQLDEDRIVPAVDLELGLAWLGPKGHVRISAGYLISAWFNMVTTPGWIESVQNQSYSPGDDVLTFDGLTARIQLAF